MRRIAGLLWIVALGGIAGPVWAAAKCAPPPVYGPNSVKGDFSGRDMNVECTEVDYASQLGPNWVDTPAPKVAEVWTPPARETQRIAIPKAIDEEEAPESVGEMDFDYNARQMMRLGELDALQGHPMNMKYSSNLQYLKGFTHGQDERLKTGGVGGALGGLQGAGRGGNAGGNGGSGGK